MRWDRALAAQTLGGARRPAACLSRYVDEPVAASPTSPIWRGGCQGAGVDGCCPAGGAGVMWLRLAGRSERSRGSRRLVMLIFGGWVPQDLGSSHVRCLKSSAPAGGGCSGDESRSCVREPGSLGPPRQPQRVVGVQRELVSLLRVAGVGVGAGAVVGQVAISQQ
jgi:hypothetical protein